jgi:hypothetical protein
MCSTCGCKSAETGKKNCGCGQDPCKTYGAETSEELIQYIENIFPNGGVITWKERATEMNEGWSNFPQTIIEGVSNMKDSIGDDEVYFISSKVYYEYEQFGAEIVFFDTKGRTQKQFFEDFMKANRGKEHGDMFNDSHMVKYGFGLNFTHNNVWEAESESDRLHSWATNMRLGVRDLIEDLEQGAVYDLDDCRERLEKIRDDTSHLDAEYHRDSKGRFTEKPVLTGSVIGGLALGLIYLMRGNDDN